MLCGLTKDRPDAATGISASRYFGVAGLRAYWPFTSGSLIDFSGKGADATVFGSPYFKGGVRGRGHAYAGTGTQDSANFLQVSGTSNASVKNLGACSMAFWTIYYSDPTGTAAFYEELGNSWGTPQFSTFLTTSGTIQGTIRTSAGSAYSTSQYTLSKGTWHHVVLTFSGANNRLRLFVDGKYLYYTQTSGAFVENNTSVKIHILGRKSSASDNFNTRTIDGFMTDIAIFDYELSVREVSGYYSFALAQQEPPVTKHFPSLYVAPPTALRQRVSRPISKSLVTIGRRLHLSHPFSNSLYLLDSTTYTSYGRSTSNGGTATGVTYTSCPPLGGAATTFAGNSGSYVSLGSGNVVVGDTVNTISFWIRWDNQTTGQSLTGGWENTNFICGTSASGSGTHWIMEYFNPSHATRPDTIGVMAYQYTGSIWRSNYSPPLKTQVGVWYHFAVYIDPFDYNNIRWYKNGQMLNGNTNGGGNWTSFASPTSNEFRLGWCYPTGSYPSSIAGAMREFQILARYTHPKTILEYYNARINQQPFHVPAIYTTADITRQRAILQNPNKSEFSVKGDIRPWI